MKQTKISGALAQRTDPQLFNLKTFEIMKKTYSYNSGRPVDKFVVPTLAQTINLFDKLRRSGKVFRVDFIKRGDGSMRTMVCRFGVKKYLKGGKKAFDAGDKGLFTVWEFGKGYRSITIDNLELVKVGGVAYLFNTNRVPGESSAEGMYNFGSRTIAASTSPLYEQAEA